MLARFLKGSDWTELAGYLSPAFLDVVSPLALAGRVQTLAKGYVTGNGYRAARTEVAKVIAGNESCVELGIGDDFDRDDLERENGLDGLRHGYAVLDLFFRQLMHSDVMLLDLRQGRFHVDGTRYIWNPSPLFVTWSPEFILSLRNLYRGFYEEDDAMFTKALRELGLERGKDVLLQHFGANRHAVTFRLADFRTTFNGLFVAARAGKARLHPDFLAFGAGLSCLYEHMERLGGPFDVAAAFAKAAN